MCMVSTYCQDRSNASTQMSASSQSGSLDSKVILAVTEEVCMHLQQQSFTPQQAADLIAAVLYNGRFQNALLPLLAGCG